MSASDPFSGLVASSALSRHPWRADIQGTFTEKTVPPDTARTQQAALDRVQRLQAKEDKARKRYEQDKSKSDGTLKQLAAKAAKDGAAKKKLEEVNGGKGDRKDGTPASGPVQGGKGMGPHKKNPVGDKSAKEAAKWSTKLAAASKKSQLPPEVPGANEAPQVNATDGGKGAEGGGGAAAGAGGGGGGAAAVAAAGGGGGTGSTDKAKELTNAPPSKYAVKISETGKKITDEAKSEVSAKNDAMPMFSAEMKGEDADGKKGEKLKGLDKSVGDGKDGSDAAAPKLKKEKRIRTGKGKPGSDIKGAGGDAGADALKSLFSASLDKIDSKSSTNTSPGPSPTVQFGGSSDPMRGNRAQEDANKKSDDAYVKAVQAVDAGPGPEQVQPLELKEDIPAANAELPPIPDVPTPAQAQEYIDKGHASDVYDKADELQKTNFDEALAEAESQFEQAGDNLETDHAAKVEEASKAVDEENKKAQESQEAEVKKARADIDKGQKDTKKKQEKELVKAKRKGDKEKKSAQQKIEKRRKDDDRKISKKYKEAEKKAESKKKAAEKKAAAKKKAAEKKKSDESWWSRAASAVGSFIDSVANAVSGIFDAMAKAVGDILNKVKDLATSMIDAAISFATSALDALGDALKGLVDGLLGDIFPGLAAALNDLIDSAVNLAKDAVNAVGEKLKAAVTAAIDALNAGIQAAINTFKAAVSTALAIASAIASGDWEAAFKAMLEGALSLAGINPSEFYGLVGEGMDTINAIIDDPMSFVSNMIGAVGNGFSQFADNFGSHLLNGAVEWLTGSLGEAGITLPDTWDAAGIFGMIADILGVSFDKLKDKIGERIGEDNVAMLESVWGYVEAAMNGGIAGLWDHAKDQLGDLWSGLLDSAIAMLTEQVITAAIMKIATMWNPAGAIVQAIITVWNVYNFVQEQAERIMGLVTSVVDSMSNIVQGQLGQASNFIEGALGDLVPVAISLLANLLGLGGISKKVKGIIEKIQEQVDKAIDWVLDKLFELGKAAWEALKKTMGPSGAEDPSKEADKAEKPPEVTGGDPAKLPKATLATVIGAMELGWDAVQGGQGATATLTGKFAGKVGGQSIPAMQAEADKMEGPSKADATKYLSTAKTQVLAVDSRGGKWIRGETDEIGPIKESFDLLAGALLEGANALGKETGGDKAKSEADHGKLADDAKKELEAPKEIKDYKEARKVAEASADKLKADIKPKLEPDVQITITFGSAAEDEKDEAIDVEILIAPNDTKLNASWKWVKSLVTGGDLDRNARWQIQGFSGTMHVLMVKAKDKSGFEYAEQEITKFDKQIIGLEGKGWAKKAKTDGQDPHPGSESMAKMLKEVEDNFTKWYAKLFEQALEAASGKDPKEALAAVIKLQQDWAAPLKTVADALAGIEINSPLVAKQLAALEGTKLLDPTVFKADAKASVITEIDGFFAKKIAELLVPIGKATTGGSVATAVKNLEEYVAGQSDLSAYGVELSDFATTKGKLGTLEDDLTNMIMVTFTQEAMAAANGKDPLEALEAVVALQNTWATNLTKGVTALEKMGVSATKLSKLTKAMATKEALAKDEFTTKRAALVTAIDTALAAKVKQLVANVAAATDAGALKTATTALHSLLSANEALSTHSVEWSEMTQTLAEVAKVDVALADQLYVAMNGWVTTQASSQTAAEVLAKVLAEQKKTFDGHATLIALVKKLGGALPKADARGTTAASALWAPTTGDIYPALAAKFEAMAKDLAAKAAQIAPSGKDPKSGHKALKDFADELKSFLADHKSTLLPDAKTFYGKGLGHLRSIETVVYTQIVQMAEHWAKQDKLTIDKTGMLPTFFASVMKAQKLTMGPITTIQSATSDWGLPADGELTTLKTAAGNGQMWDHYKDEVFEKKTLLGELAPGGKFTTDGGLVLAKGEACSAATKKQIKAWGFDPMTQEGVGPILKAIDTVVAQKKQLAILGDDLVEFIGPKALDEKTAQALVKLGPTDSTKEGLLSELVVQPLLTLGKSVEALVRTAGVVVPGGNKEARKAKALAAWGEVKQGIDDLTAGVGNKLSKAGGAAIVKWALGGLAKLVRTWTKDKEKPVLTAIDTAMEKVVDSTSGPTSGVPGKDINKKLDVSGAIISALSFGTLLGGALLGASIPLVATAGVLGLVGVAMTNRARDKEGGWGNAILKGFGQLFGIALAAGSIFALKLIPGATAVVGVIGTILASAAATGSVLKLLKAGSKSTKEGLQEKLDSTEKIFIDNRLALPENIETMKKELAKVDVTAKK